MEKTSPPSPQKELLPTHNPSRLSLPSFRFFRRSVQFNEKLVALDSQSNGSGNDGRVNATTSNPKSDNVMTSSSTAKVKEDKPRISRNSRTNLPELQGLSKHSASQISHGTETRKTNHEPLPALSTADQTSRLSTANPTTTAWLQQQQQEQLPENQIRLTNVSNVKRDINSKSIDERKSIIKSKATMRTSLTRKSLEMNGGRLPMYRYDSGGTIDNDDEEDDRDRTLRALEGNDRKVSYGNGNKGNEGQRQASDSDYFLDLARDDQIIPPSGINDRNSTSAQVKRRSRIALPNSKRLSMPVPPVSYSQRHIDDQNEEQSPRTSRMAPTSAYSRRERPTVTTNHTPADLNRSRYIGGIPRASPVTPRGPSFSSSREFSPDPVSPPSASRRPSIAETTSGTVTGGSRRTSAVDTSRRSSITEQPRKSSVTETALSIPRTQYRQSNLSYTSPRGYNSSPLVPKAMDGHDEREVPHESTEETESTTSTTAQSTIWDELDDIKQRMRRLEVMGKMPPTSGATISNSSNERPRTATTTATTNSTSPKRARGNSTVSPLDTASIIMSAEEAHPNLKAALAKSKTILNSDVYNALEKAANDALTLSAMMGTVGQPGPISSAQSAVGSVTGSITDRQVRKKADNMCRTLTELCIALNERKADELPLGESKSRPTTREESKSRPTTRDTEPSDSPTTEVPSAVRKVSDAGGQALARLKASPRALTRLSERRNGLFSSSSLPTSPRSSSQTEATTPTQATNPGRRTSLLLRSRRAATEDAEDGDAQDARFRAPSRAVTEVGQLGRIKTSPREYTSNRPLPQPPTPGVYTSNRPLPEVREPATPLSAIPMRRHFVSNSLTSSVPTSPSTPNAVSRLESRRYLERAASRPTPEREPQEFQPDEDNTMRKVSAGSTYEGRGMARTSSISRRLRAINSTDR